MRAFKLPFNKNIGCIQEGRGLYGHSVHLSLTWVLEILQNLMRDGFYFRQGRIFADWVKGAVRGMKHL